MAVDRQVLMRFGILIEKCGYAASESKFFNEFSLVDKHIWFYM